MSAEKMQLRNHSEEEALTGQLDRNFAILSLITGAIAFISSCILTSERLQIYIDPSHRSVCDINAILNCGTVMRTPYAEIFGFPNPFIGLVGYSVVITISMALLAKARFAPWFWISMNIGHLLALIFVFYLWYNTTFNINALCLFCMFVWVMQAIIFTRLTTRNMQAGIIPVPHHIRKGVAGWGWFTTVLILVLLFGMIVIRFFDQIINIFS